MTRLYDCSRQHQCNCAAARQAERCPGGCLTEQRVGAQYDSVERGRCPHVLDCAGCENAGCRC
eukprot:1188580-Prorocentrum_minimum.AAC.6